MALRSLPRSRFPLTRSLWLLPLCLMLAVPNAHSYSVLSHEEIVDLVWEIQLQPMLRHRFPKATDDDLRKAHAFAYGGSLVADMGYYPFGNQYFSDLLHYVRSGDFTVQLLRDAQETNDLNDYAFALGALSHYAADNYGHPAINRSVAIDFPKLERKYGQSVTYVDDPKAHIRTEFGFDMVQVAKNRYTSDRYHDFIGFEIDKPLLERAFQETYGMPLSDVIKNEDLAIGTFRRAISQIIPEMTRVALLARKKEIVQDTPNFNEKKFLYYISRKDYEKDWGTSYRRPGFGTRVLSFFLRIVPKVGPFKAVAFKIPTTQTEDMYIKSIDLTIDQYRGLLRESRDPHFTLTNKDYDTGRDTRAGEYELTDKTYQRLLSNQAGHHFENISPQLRDNILAFYSDLNAPIYTKRSKKTWATTLSQLDSLRHADIPPNAAAPASGGL
jgi:Zinc dependent phospholipase C